MLWQILRIYINSSRPWQSSVHNRPDDSLGKSKNKLALSTSGIPPIIVEEE